MLDAAYNLDYEERYEIIEGVKKFMSPSPGWIHGTIDSTLIMIFKNYCRKHKCGLVFGDNIDVHLPDEKNVFMPDVSIVCDDSILREGGTIYGAPDLVVEILSKSTAKNDFSIKKDAYERNGVKEYWIVNPLDESIHVYHLINGKYELNNIYHVYTPAELTEMEEDKRAAIPHQIKVSIFEDLFVEVDEVFYDI